MNHDVRQQLVAAGMPAGQADVIAGLWPAGTERTPQPTGQAELHLLATKADLEQQARNQQIRFHEDMLKLREHLVTLNVKLGDLNTAIGVRLWLQLLGAGLAGMFVQHFFF